MIRTEYLIREGEHGGEYVIAWAAETGTGNDIVLTAVDIDNLMRAKAAIYGGFTVLAQSVGFELSDVERVVIGGSFGKYLNVEKSVQIGLLPDRRKVTYEGHDTSRVDLDAFRAAEPAMVAKYTKRETQRTLYIKKGK